MDDKKESNQFRDTQTNKRIHEHLSSEKDIISDEDISNVKTDVTEKGIISSDKTSESRGIHSDEKENERHIKRTGRTDDPGIQTSWNILND